METNEVKKMESRSGVETKNNPTSRRGLLTGFILLLVLFSSNVALAHCDTMDGPLIADARKAIAQHNVSYVLKWVPAANEAEVNTAFNLVMKVRGLSPEAGELADKYFFDTVVRIHRVGEGVSFTGIKPSGTPIDKKILAADRSIETGNLSPLKGLVADDLLPELTKRFEKVMSLRNFDVNDVAAGREYIEAYVKFFKYAEGEEDEHSEN